MPSFDNLPLPEVNLSAPMDIDALAAKLADHPMAPEAMIELIVYFKREREKAAALSEIEEVLRGRLAAIYEKTPVEKRETRRTEVGYATYSNPKETVSLKDRDWTVENLTEEQLRITYKPDLKAMETILKPDEFERHVTRKSGKSTLTVRDQSGSDEFYEIDF